MKPFPRAQNVHPRLAAQRPAKKRRRRKPRVSLIAALIVVSGAFVYGGVAVFGNDSAEPETVVATSAKVAALKAESRVATVRPPVRTLTPPRPESPPLRADLSPRGASSGIRRGELLPGERFDAALRRMGIAQTEIRRLVRSLVAVFDTADSHAGDTFIAQTDAAGAILWFELRTLRGASIGARRQNSELTAYRKDAAPGQRRAPTGNAVHAAARNG